MNAITLVLKRVSVVMELLVVLKLMLGGVCGYGGNSGGIHVLLIF